MDAGTLAVILIFGVPFFAIWTGHKHKVAKMEIENAATGTAEKAAQYAAQITRLEDRVQVLERIVTDRGYNVAAQIEALRDTTEVEQSDSGVPLEISKKEQV